MNEVFKVYEVVPHGEEFLLPQEIIEHNDESVITKFTVGLDDHFLDENNNIPTYIGLEYMAQTIAVYAGCFAKKNNKPIVIGFLIGARKFEIFEDCFLLNNAYLIQANILFQEDGLGSFSCQITNEHDNRLICQSNVNVYQPDDIDAFFKDNGILK